MRNFLIISVLFFISTVGMAALFASMAGEQGMKNYFVDVVQQRMNCVDADWREEKIPARHFTELRIKSISTDMKFELSETDEMTVEYAAANLPKVSQQAIYKIEGSSILFDLESFIGDDQKLQLNFQQGNQFNLRVENVPMRLKIPKSIKKIYIDSTSGNAKFDSLTLELVDIITVSGDIRFVKARVETLQLKTTSGDLKFKGDLQSVKAHSVSGDLKFELTNASSAAVIETTSGDVKVDLKENKDFNVQFDSTSGQARHENENYNYNAGNSIKISANAPLWKVRTVSGDFKLSEYEDFEEREHIGSVVANKSLSGSSTQLKKCSDFRVFGFKFD